MNKLPILVILAGGAGKRFWPLTNDKPLFSFAGKPLIGYISALAAERKFASVVIVTPFQTKAVYEALTLPVPHTVVVQEKPLGMADAVLTVKDIVTDNPVLIMIADDLVEPVLFDQILKKAEDPSVFGVVVGWKPKNYFHGGYLKCLGDRVVEIIEKPGEGREPSPYVYISSQYVKDARVLIHALEEIQGLSDDVYEKGLTNVMKTHHIAMIPYTDAFTTLKFPWHVLDVNAMLLSQLKRKIGRNVEIKKNVILEGAIVIEDNVTIYENTKIIGPCFIGQGSIIGNNNIIRASHIGKRCVTGFNTDITRSYIGNDCWFHSNYIGDSVLESDVSLGSGTVLANLRLDEGDISSVVGKEFVSTKRNKCGALIGSHVRIGVNVSIMPGIKIGSNTCIGAGITITSDIQSDSFCVGKKSSYTVKKNTRSVNVSMREQFRAKI